MRNRTMPPLLPLIMQRNVTSYLIVHLAPLSFLLALSGFAPSARALVDGAAPMLVGLKIATPAGDAVEISTNDESLSSVSLEVEVESDRQGVAYFELGFRSPDGSRTATYWGSGDWSPTKSDPLRPRDETKLTFVLGAGRLRKFYESRGFDRPLAVPGDWVLESAWLYGRNGKSAALRAANGNFPAGLTRSFRVTHWFSKQPTFTSVPLEGPLSLAPELNTSQVPNPTFQWFRNGTAIPGATGRVFSRAKASADDAGLYYLQVSSGVTKVRSDAVPVSIRRAEVVAARSWINLQNAAQAKAQAGAAVRSRDGGEERFVSALSELLGVVSDPATGVMLAKMGAKVTPKFPFSDFYWSGSFPATANSSEFSNWLDTAFLPALERADKHLEGISDQRFVTWVSGADFAAWSPEGGASDLNLLVDYGDLQVLRVGMNALMAFFRLWSSMDTSVRLDTLQRLQPEGKLSVEALLGDYPNLLAGATNGSLNQRLSVDAMARAATAYERLSDFVYNPKATPGAVTRYIDGDLNLFNFERQFAEDGILDRENDPYFRDHFSNISKSTTEGVRDFITESETGKGVVSRYPVNLKALKERPAGLRSSVASQNLVPAFKGNLVVGTVSNGSLNGVLPRLDPRPPLARLAAYEPQITEALGTRDAQSAPVLLMDPVPLTGGKILLGPGAGAVRLSGTVRYEGQISGVEMERTMGSVKASFQASLQELPPVEVAGTRVRRWTWTVDLPFNEVGPFNFAIYATDQAERKSPAVTGAFTVARAVRVFVTPPDPAQGTVTVTPPIAASGMVETGTRLRVSAVPRTGYLFQMLAMVVDGVGVGDVPRATSELIVAGDTVMTPKFVVNPFAAAAGQWTGTTSNAGAAPGLVSVVVTKTGAFTLRLTQGRNSVSRSGVLDASGNALIKLPPTFFVVGTGGSPQTVEQGSLRLDNGLKFSFGNVSTAASGALSKAASVQMVGSLRSKRFNAALGEALSPVGYASFDVSTSGSVFATGMFNVAAGSLAGVAYPQKTVKYSFSVPLVVIPTSNPTRFLPGVNVYGLASDICINGPVLIDDVILSGSAGLSAVFDPSKPATVTASYGSLLVNGSAYVAPRAGQLVPPFAAGSRTSFVVSAAARMVPTAGYAAQGSTLGELKLTGFRPVFRYTAVSAPSSSGLVVKGATMSITAASGSFSGSLSTQHNAPLLRRMFYGVVLRSEGPQTVGPLAVGMSTDGLLISFE